MSLETSEELPFRARKVVQSIAEATILFAGDSGDGMQLTGSQFTLATAFAQNDLATLPDFPAEIRAPAGTTYGVSGFQLRFGSVNIRTPGDEVDLLVAMNPAALKVNLNRLRSNGAIMVNANAFTPKDLRLAGYDTNPLEDASLKDYQVFEVELTKMTREALKDSDLDKKEIDRSKNMFALGLALWLYSRPMEPTIDWLSGKFASKPAILDANIHLLKKGYHFGETTEDFIVRYEVQPAQLKPGLYRAIRGAEAIAMGRVAASQQRPDQPGAWAVQAGSFSSLENARRLAATLQSMGYDSFISETVIDGRKLHRVRIGPLADRKAADRIANELQQQGQPAKSVPHP